MDIMSFLLIKLRPYVNIVFPSLSSKIESLPSDIPDRMMEYTFVMRELKLESGRVLDVGCTSPYNIIPLFLAEQGLEVFGIDVREFKIQHPNFKFYLGDIRETSFPGSYFNRIIAVSTIEHIGLRGRYTSEQDLEGDRKAISEIVRILKKGGNLLLTVPFGKAKIVRASHRVYDAKGLAKLADPLTVVNKAFYVKDENGYWVRSEERDAEQVDASLVKEYAVACLNLVKP